MTNLEKLKKYIDESNITYEVSEFSIVIFSGTVVFNPSNDKIIPWVSIEFNIYYDQLTEPEKNELVEHIKDIVNHQQN